MSISTKLKKVQKSSEKAKDKLVKMASGTAKKKKILDQVDEIRELGAELTKLEKKAKAELKSKKKKAPKSKVKPKAKAKAPKVKKDKKQKKSSDKKNPKVIAANTSLAAVVSADSLKVLSTSLNAKMAIAHLRQLKTVKQVQTYIKGEDRKTVLERAQSRTNAINRG